MHVRDTEETGRQRKISQDKKLICTINQKKPGLTMLIYWYIDINILYIDINILYIYITQYIDIRLSRQFFISFF